MTRSKQRMWERENPCFDALALVRGLEAARFKLRSVKVWLHGAAGDDFPIGPHATVDATFDPVDPQRRVAAERVGRKLGLVVEGGGSSMVRDRKTGRYRHVESDTSWLLLPASGKRKMAALDRRRKRRA